jgi:hypothetical protein
MFSKFWAVIEVIKGLINVFNFLRDSLRRKQANDDREKQVELEKAVDESKTAQTDEEVWNAQDRVTDNKP